MHNTGFVLLELLLCDKHDSCKQDFGIAVPKSSTIQNLIDIKLLTPFPTEITPGPDKGTRIEKHSGTSTLKSAAKA